MVVKNMQLMLERDNLVAPLTLLSIVSVAFKPRNFISNFTINKTWHADSLGTLAALKYHKP